MAFATLAVWMMTLLIQGTNRRDTLALGATSFTISSSRIAANIPISNSWNSTFFAITFQASTPGLREI
jgi:hypothetical protein